MTQHGPVDLRGDTDRSGRILAGVVFSIQTEPEPPDGRPSPRFRLIAPVGRPTIILLIARFSNTFNVLLQKTYGRLSRGQSHKRVSYEKDGSFAAHNSAATRRCINFFFCRWGSSAAHVLAVALSGEVTSAIAEDLRSLVGRLVCE